jgi:tRNA A-37 threonylcarbamoyl transferase component Bud32
MHVNTPSFIFFYDVDPNNGLLLMHKIEDAVLVCVSRAGSIYCEF